MSKNENSRDILRLLLGTTLVFALLLGTGVWLHGNLPRMRSERIEAELDAGNFVSARRIAERFRDEALSLPLLQKCDYLEAVALLEDGHTAQAEALLAALGNYEDAATLLQDCRYELALQAKEEGRWEEAIALYESLSGWDVLGELDECRYGLAAELAAQGADTEAVALYSALGDYKDSRKHMGELAMRITGIDDPEMAANALSGLTAEELAQQDALAARREALPRGIIDVGHRHTVGLCTNGSVLACGDNSYGQCDVSAWKDITAVAAGAYHTVGLRSDGTVVASGRGSEGQCDTADWRDIVEIAAGDYATFGLRADGTVLYCGHNDYPVLSGWSGITHISGGSYALGALRGGTALIPHEAARSDELQGLADLALNSGFAVGLRSTGTVVSPGFDLDWKQIVSISASGTGILGLTADGNVRSHFFRESNRLDFSGITDAVAIAAGGTHSAVVHADGSVSVFGRCDEGQGTTTDWQLFG